VTRPTRHFVLAAGGTGGHLTPAFALAQELERRGHHVALITDRRGAEIPGKPDFLPAHVLPAGRFGKNPITWPKGLSAVLEGRRMALRLFESFEPSAVVGFGGYPALPALLAARSAGIASVVHEQNAVLGRVNRLLAGRVNAIATAYPDVDGCRRNTSKEPTSSATRFGRKCWRCVTSHSPRSRKTACCGFWSPAAARGRGCCRRSCPTVSRCCSRRCGAACR
jgi:UDP-N-acetylglucosamine:LPS N-acetylglucosamine transferase